MGLLKGEKISLNFAAISPHPPIIVPGIGSNEDLQEASSTVLGMKKLASAFRTAEIETLIVISPHMLVYPDRFNICGMKKIFGSFASFGAPDIMMEFNNDSALAHEFNEVASKNNIRTLLYDNGGEFFEMDHGLMVPLFYLSQEQESVLKVLPMAYSSQDRSCHFTFGQIIGEVIKKNPSRVGVIASGDLSHRLISGAPGGYSKAGKDFDKKLVANLESGNSGEIMLYDEEFIEDAGECGYRSILILLGILDGMKIKPEILSYEGPFGVGYLVANYKLKD